MEVIIVWPTQETESSLKAGMLNTTATGIVNLMMHLLW